jgi:hypothetical protein
MMADASSLGNPFAALTVIVAPAILTNASSVLCMGTANRVARVVDRTRQVAAELADISDAGSRAYQIRVSQLELLHVRSHKLFWALRFTYASLGLFASAALVAVLGSIAFYYNLQLAFETLAFMGFAVFVLAVSSLGSGCVLMVREVQLALTSLEDEAKLAREHYKP